MGRDNAVSLGFDVDNHVIVADVENHALLWLSTIA